MREILLVIYAEIRKQKQHNYHSYFVYFSLLIWPILGFLEVYYTYKPFELTGNIAGIGNAQTLLAFLATGYMAYNCFWSMVQNAWSMSYDERTGGTLEIAFLTPANRLALNYGKALGALIQEAWMFCCFCLFILFYTRSLSLANWYLFPLIFLLLVASSTIWGGMLNAIFLFSRDASIIMDLFDTPMLLFSGTRIPLNAFPLWARLISLLFPLTYCLNLIRLTLHIHQQPTSLFPDLIKLLICLTTMIAITQILLKKAEQTNRQTGELLFY
ncbi:ABC transporter permease [Roseburia hominis]